MKNWHVVWPLFLLLMNVNARATESVDFVCTSEDLEVDLRNRFANLDFVATQLHDLKSETDLDAYMKCDTDKADYKAFVSTYKKQVKKAVEIFSLNYDLLACALFIESTWNKDSSSGVAFGLSQFKQTTLNDINEVLENAEKHDSKYYLDRRARDLKERDRLIDLHTRKKTLTEAKKKEILAKYEKKVTGTDNEERVNIRQRFLKDKIMKYWKSIYPKKAFPIKFTKNDLFTPEISIGLGAMYFAKILTGDTFAGTTAIDIMTASAGAYNLGPPKFLEIFELNSYSIEKTSAYLKNCSKQKLGEPECHRRDECVRHMKKFKTCVEKGAGKTC